MLKITTSALFSFLDRGKYPAPASPMHVKKLSIARARQYKDISILLLFFSIARARPVGNCSTKTNQHGGHHSLFLSLMETNITTLYYYLYDFFFFYSRKSNKGDLFTVPITTIGMLHLLKILNRMHVHILCKVGTQYNQKLVATKRKREENNNLKEMMIEVKIRDYPIKCCQ